MRNLKFALVITDLRRGNNPNAGLELLKKIENSEKGIPVVIYTLGAEEKRRELIDAGARAVVDTPSELIGAVLAHRPR